MAVYGYIRVSTPNQNTARQEDALHGEADRVFVDKLSGADTQNRPQFLKLMGLIGEGDTLLVTSLDRAFRSLRDALDTIERLQELKAHFRSLDQAFDTTSPHGELFFHISAAFAQFERKIAAKRRDEGIEAAKARGVQFGRPKSLNRGQVLHAMIQVEHHGKSQSEMAEILGVDRSTLWRAIKAEKEIRAVPHDVRRLSIDIGAWAILKELDLFDSADKLHEEMAHVPRVQKSSREIFDAALEVARHMEREPKQIDEG